MVSLCVRLLAVMLFAVIFVFSVLRMISMVSWKIWEARIIAGTVVNVARAHLSQRKIVQGSEHWTITGFLCAKVNCDAAFFRDVGVIWIVRDSIVIIFSVKNILNIQLVKRSGNNAANCLAWLIVFQPGCIDSRGFVPAKFSS